MGGKSSDQQPSDCGHSCFLLASPSRPPARILRPAPTAGSWIRHGHPCARGTRTITPSPLRTASTRRRYVEVGGIRQWITIRGEDRNNPVLLFLHGGPGDATNPWGYAGFRSSLKHFTVVQSDQRGAGQNIGKEPGCAAAGHKVARMTQDGVELTELLRKQLRKDKIISSATRGDRSLASTWSKRGPISSTRSSDGAGGHPATSYAVAYGELLKKAEDVKDEHAVRELREVGPPPYPDGRGYRVQRKWSSFSRARTRLSSPWSASPSLRRLHAARCQRLVRWSECQWRAPGSANEHPRARTLAGDFAIPGFRHSGR